MKMVRMVLFVSLVACEDNLPTPSPYCDTSYSGCRSALAMAEVTCERKLKCDWTYEHTMDECVEWTMPALCEQIDCDKGYAYADALDECLANYSATPCDEVVTVCGFREGIE